MQFAGDQKVGGSLLGRVETALRDFVVPRIPKRIETYHLTLLVKWGYYMDHFLDYTFLCAILIGYSFIVPPHLKFLQFFILAVCGGFMVNAYLDFAATNEFRISHLGIGPTEVRLIFIVVNTLLIFFGKTYMAVALPYALILATLGLWYVVYRTQNAPRRRLSLARICRRGDSKPHVRSGLLWHDWVRSIAP